MTGPFSAKLLSDFQGEAVSVDVGTEGYVASTTFALNRSVTLMLGTTIVWGEAPTFS